jgi:hypothetical protein
VTDENADGPLDAMPCGRARLPRRQARGDRAALASRGWGLARAAQGKPVGHLAHRQHSRARPGCFSVGQPSVDRDFLQKIELCDKNGRYESCR